jgi:heme/copper-type cytochrome/quinol oxidase subunit 1
LVSRSEVYRIVAGLGIASEVIATNARKPIFGYRAMIMSIIAIGFLSTIVLGHHVCFWYESIFWVQYLLYNTIDSYSFRR